MSTTPTGSTSPLTEVRRVFVRVLDEAVGVTAMVNQGLTEWTNRRLLFTIVDIERLEHFRFYRTEESLLQVKERIGVPNSRLQPVSEANPRICSEQISTTYCTSPRY